MHEQFCKQIKLQPLKSSFVCRPFVSQLDGEEEEMQPNEVAAMQRKPLKCWNCDSLGQKKNVFKPKCQTCNPSENRQKDASANNLLPHPKH